MYPEVRRKNFVSVVRILIFNVCAQTPLPLIGTTEIKFFFVEFQLIFFEVNWVSEKVIIYKYHYLLFVKTMCAV